MADTLYNKCPNVYSKQRGGIRGHTLVFGGVARSFRFLDGFKNIYRYSLHSVLHGAVNFHISIVQFYKILNRKVLGNHSAKTQRLYSRSRRKAMKMFVTIVVCFALCWLPDHVSYFLITYNDEFYNCGLPRNIDFISLFFAYAISALNPCIYIILNQHYRNGAKRLLTTC